MAVKIRLARGGAKKRPYYRLVVANATAPRDGNFIEKVGTYNPFLPHENQERVTLKKDRIEYWLAQGAIPTERVTLFITAAGVKLPEGLERKMAIKVKSRTIKAPKKENKQ